MMASSTNLRKNVIVFERPQSLREFVQSLDDDVLEYRMEIGWACLRIVCALLASQDDINDCNLVLN